jgi:Uma2 family endonuclease
MYQANPPLPPHETLPTMYDLPSENQEESGVPDEFHNFQPELLRLTFRPPSYSSEEIFTGSDLNLYYDSRHTNWYKRPDWFGVLGVSRLYQERNLRLSYVVWQESVNPFVAVELLSPGTEQEDLGKTLREVNKPPTKWEVYERILRIPYYFIFDRYTDKFQAFGLVTNCYESLTLEPQGVWLKEAQLGLGLWQGSYQGIDRLWLRWYDDQGNWLLTPEEQERSKVKELEAILAKYQQRFGNIS